MRLLPEKPPLVDQHALVQYIWDWSDNALDGDVTVAENQKFTDEAGDQVRCGLDYSFERRRFIRASDSERPPLRLNYVLSNTHERQLNIDDLSATALAVFLDCGYDVDRIESARRESFWWWKGAASYKAGRDLKVHPYSFRSSHGVYYAIDYRAADNQPYTKNIPVACTEAVVRPKQAVLASRSAMRFCQEYQPSMGRVRQILRERQGSKLDETLRALGMAAALVENQTSD